jgi:hypothetical protein
MMTAVVVGKIEKVGPDYIWWRSRTDKRQINFADNWASTKEDWAASFRGLEGRPAAIPVGGPFYITVDFLPGDFEGTARVIQSPFPVASVERL